MIAFKARHFAGFSAWLFPCAWKRWEEEVFWHLPCRQVVFFLQQWFHVKCIHILAQILCGKIVFLQMGTDFLTFLLFIVITCPFFFFPHMKQSLLAAFTLHLQCSSFSALILLIMLHISSGRKKIVIILLLQWTLTCWINVIRAEEEWRHPSFPLLSVFAAASIRSCSKDSFLPAEINPSA